MTKSGLPKKENLSQSSSQRDGSDSRSRLNQNISGNESLSGAPAQKETEKPTKTSKGQKTKSHFKKHWKYYTVGVVLALAVILPLLFKVVIPLIIQRVINSREIKVEHASVYIRNSVEIDFSANASVKSPLPARVGKLEFTLHDTTEDRPLPVLTADIDGFPISKSTNIDIRQKKLFINDSEALVSWADRFIDSETIPFDVQVKDIDVFLGQLRYNANVNRPITIKGLRGLRDITVDDLKLALPPVENKNLRANISLSNPSSLSVQVGNVTVEIRVNDVKVADALAYNVSLVPGRTLIYIDGVVDIPAIVNNLGGILRQQAGPLAAGHVSAQIKVTGFSMHGERIKFLETLLSARALDLTVPLAMLVNEAATGILKAGLAGMGSRNGTEMGDTSLFNAIGSVFSNTTLMDRIQGHWNRRRASR